MSEFEIEVNEGMIARWERDRNGFVVTALQDAAWYTVIWDVKDAISEPAVETSPGWYALNRPPGPPKVRSGQLWSSVGMGNPEVDERGVNVPVTVFAVNPKDQWLYSKTLGERQYRFVKEGRKYRYDV